MVIFKVMTTMDEFNKITQIMYEGYVMVNLAIWQTLMKMGKRRQSRFIFQGKHRLSFRRTMYVITIPRMEMNCH
ncbi:MAG: hypothetical protein ACLRMZ_27385 [Blautia marasmi]